MKVEDHGDYINQWFLCLRINGDLPPFKNNSLQHDVQLSTGKRPSFISNDVISSIKLIWRRQPEDVTMLDK